MLEDIPPNTRSYPNLLPSRHAICYTDFAFPKQWTLNRRPRQLNWIAPEVPLKLSKAILYISLD